MYTTLAAATNFQGGHFAKLQHDPVVRAVARFATAAVGHIVEMKTVHYGLTHYNAMEKTLVFANGAITLDA
ncbi:hypothetical protein T492DRAFT_884146 [Pavlovales sp. CCMP2436]|nr:hypothetical protein T492DRAFT_884146 [Pavlovales sp. CCMP2436]